MTGTQTAALAVALVTPVVIMLAVGGLRPGPRSALPPVWWAQAAAVVPAGAWLALVATGARGDAGGFYVTPLVAAAGCGTALVTAAVIDGMSRRQAVSAAYGALAAVGLGLTAGGDGAQAVAVVGGLALAAALTVAGSDATAPRSDRKLPALLAAGGVVACGIGFAMVHARSGRWTLPTTTSPLSTGAIMAFLACGALLAASGTLGRRRELRSGTEPSALLLAGGLAVALSAAPLRAGGVEFGAAVVILATAAVVAAGVRRGPLSLALLALAAAAGPAALVPASRLLAASAVIAVVDLPWSWAVAVPGAVSLVTGVVDDGSRLAVAAAVGAAAVAALLAHGGVEEGARTRGVALGALPAAAVGVWLVVAPGTWTWTGADLGAYDLGMGRAVAGGLLVVVARVLFGEVRHRPTTGSPRRLGSGPPRPARHERRSPQLVPSSRSASTPRPRRAPRSQRARPFGRVPARPPTGGRTPRRRRSRPPKA